MGVRRTLDDLVEGPANRRFPQCGAGVEPPRRERLNCPEETKDLLIHVCPWCSLDFRWWFGRDLLSVAQTVGDVRELSDGLALPIGLRALCSNEQSGDSRECRFDRFVDCAGWCSCHWVSLLVRLLGNASSPIPSLQL